LKIKKGQTLYLLLPEVVAFPEALAGEVESEAKGQRRKQLELLSLVLQDLRFRLSRVQLRLIKRKCFIRNFIVHTYVHMYVHT
jgi:hypothetical protein